MCVHHVHLDACMQEFACVVHVVRHVSVRALVRIDMHVFVCVWLGAGVGGLLVFACGLVCGYACTCLQGHPSPILL